MAPLLAVVELVVQVLFVALGLACLRLWLRERGQAAAWSAVAFGLLAAVLVVSRISEAVSGDDPPLLVTKLVVTGLVLCPFFLYRFSRVPDPLDDVLPHRRLPVVERRPRAAHCRSQANASSVGRRDRNGAGVDPGRALGGCRRRPVGRESPLDCERAPLLRRHRAARIRARDLASTRARSSA